MNEVIRFALLGLGVGALYAFASQGLIVIYRGTGVLNFSLGATAIAGVFLQWELQFEHGWPFLPSAGMGVVLSAVLGILTHWVIMRPLRRASSLIRVIATLGVLVTIQAGVVIRYGSNARQVESWLPTERITLWGDVSITADRLILLAISSASAFLLWVLYRSSQFGLATEAVSESERSASAVGVSPNRIAVLNWALGSAIACLAGILVIPIITLQVTAMTSLVLAALAAALVGDFRSFPIATATGLVLGIGQTLVGRFAPQEWVGFETSLPFLVIIVFLVFRGRALPLRDYFLKEMPQIGNGRMSWDWTVFCCGAIVFLMLTKQTKWIDALTVSLGVAIVLLSIVVLTGYAGQLSLAQYSIAGFGAYVAGRLVAVFDIPFLLGLVAGVAAAVPLGVVFGLPAVRTRGINLAIVTLGLGTTIELMIFGNRNLTGGVQGTQVGNPSLFGYDIGSISHPERYGIFVLAMAMLAVWVVANVRRGRSGRRLIAVRTNERAAAALGIDVMLAKLFAFSLASAIAALGGILIAFRLTSISYQSFTTFTSITFVGLALLGGVGYLLGAFVGSTMATAGFSQEVIESTWGEVGRWIQLISGIAILLTVLQYKDGVAAEWARIYKLLKRAKKWGRPYFIRLEDIADIDTEHHAEVPAHTLATEGLTVRYGAVVAVDDVSFRLTPGTVTGLIGPNGAGKTSLIDALSGFTPAEGRVLLDDHDLSKWSPTKRARAGVARSFQSLELFEDSTVFENISVAADPQDFRSYLRDLVWPVNPPFPPEVVRAIKEFELDEDLHRDVNDLSYGKRRLLAIARAVAMHPSVLLLDEPAAGLSSAESVDLGRVVRRLADEWGMAILVVEHDMDFVMTVCDEVIVLDFGQLIASGPPEAIRNDPAVIAAYLGDETDAATSRPKLHPAAATIAGGAS